MRKILAIGLSVAMILSLTACGNSEKKTSKGDAKTFTVGFDAEYPPYGYMDQES